MRSSYFCLRIKLFFIPRPNNLGRKLFEKTGNPKTFYAIEGEGHNDTYILGGVGDYDALNRFITETLKNSNNRG
jgi:hypothetical protein